MKKFNVILVLVLILCLALTMVACDNNDDNEDDNGNTGVTPPTATDWQEAGLGGSFDVEVNGTLSTSVATEGEIFMTWKNSDEGSLDKTVSWLRAKGYTSYGGTNSNVEVLENGFISYVAEKVNDDGETVIVDVTYVTQDYSVMGQNFKAGELYFSVTKETGNVEDDDDVAKAKWPSEQIQATLGYPLPEYVGQASTFVFSDAGFELTNEIGVQAYGVSDNHGYDTLLTSAGFVYDGEGSYVKEVGDGNKIVLYFYLATGTNPVTYYQETVLYLYAMLYKSAGEYASWSQLSLGVFADGGIPEYQGATSFDLVKINSADSEEIKSIQQTIDALKVYEQYLSEEEKARLAQLQGYLPYIEQVESAVITVYGANYDSESAYYDALDNAGFANGDKTTENSYYVVGVGGNSDEGTLKISITKYPIELKGYITGEDQIGGGGGEDVEDPLYTMPENLKVTFTVSSIEYTAIKIGDDYYHSYSYYGLLIETYYKKNGDKWDIYEKDMGESAWIKLEDQEADRSYIERFVFDFMVQNVDLPSDAVEQGATTVVGRSAKVYLSSWTYGETTFTETYSIDTETGLVLKYQSTGIGNFTYEVTAFDTAVTDFAGIKLPT